MEERIANQGNTMSSPADMSVGDPNNAFAQSNMPIPSENAPNMQPMAATVPDDVDIPARVHRPVPPELPRPETMSPVSSMHMATTSATRNTPSPQMPSMSNTPETNVCGYKKGELPPCAPLAAGYVPFQQENPPKYSAADALTKGTLFPGLDLPFMNIANKSNPYAGTPLGEVMALDFACHELKLYLDTHKDDRDAFEMLKTLLALSTKGRREFESRYGPLDIRDLERADKFTWLNDPWPWEYSERQE